MANCSVETRSDAECSLRCVARWAPVGDESWDGATQERFVEEVTACATAVVGEASRTATTELVRRAIYARERLHAFASRALGRTAASSRRDISLYAILEWVDAAAGQAGGSRYVAAAVDVAAGHNTVMSVFIKRPDGHSIRVFGLPHTLGQPGNTRAAYVIDRDGEVLDTYDERAGKAEPRRTGRSKIEHGGRFGSFQSFADFDIVPAPLDVMCG